MARPINRDSIILIGQVYRTTQDTPYKLCLIGGIKPTPDHPLVKQHYHCVIIHVTDMKGRDISINTRIETLSKSDIVEVYKYLHYCPSFPHYLFSRTHMRHNPLEDQQKRSSLWFREHYRDTDFAKPSLIYDDWCLIQSGRYTTQKQK